MKYSVFNKETKEYEIPERCVVTQHGEVAFWDESNGWDICPNQEKFEIISVVDEEPTHEQKEAQEA